MTRFSVRQILLVILALAFGFAIWRLPKGSWIDVPLAALSFFFALSLCRHAAATRRLLAAHCDLPRDQRWGGRLLFAGLLGTAGTLLVAWVFRFLAASESSLVDRNVDVVGNVFIGDVRQSTLPLNLAVLAMLVATGLLPWQFARATRRPLRQKLYGLLAAAGTLVLILAFWAERLLVLFLVYLAISGVEATWPPSWLPPDIHLDSSVRIHYFAVGSLAGLPLLVANVALVAVTVWLWRKPGLRWMLTILLSMGLAAQCWVAWWIGAKGLRQLSPELQESVDIPSVSVMLVVSLMVVLAVAAFTWRLLAKAPPPEDRCRMGQRTQYFHENWLGGLLLGLGASAQIAYGLMSVLLRYEKSLRRSLPIDFETIYYLLTSEPAQIISIAAVIGGFALSCSRWQRRNEPVVDALPCVSATQFALITLGNLILVVTSAPIIAAVSFSYWFLRFGYWK
jgi:hypothetical protein